MRLSEIIKQFRVKHKMTMQQFADKANLSKSYVSMLETEFKPANTKKHIIPSIDVYKKIANALEIDVNTLLTSVDSEISLTSDDIIKSELTSIKKINIHFSDYFFIKYNTNLSCGTFDEIMNTEPDAEVAVPIKWQWAKKRLRAFKLNGTSMNNLFYDESIIVCLDNDNNAEIYKDGTPVVVFIDGLLTFKRFYNQKDAILLVPDSNDSTHKPMLISKENNQIKIIGKIIYHVPPDAVDEMY